MKKILIFLLILSGCTTEQTQPESIRTPLHYIYDAEGKEVPPLGTTDIYFTTYKEGVIETYYDGLYDLVDSLHKEIDGFQTFEGYNNIKTINETPTNTPIAVSDDLFSLLQDSLEITKLSKGYYNPTIFELYELYNPLYSFYPTENTLPDQTLIDQAQSCVIGYEVIDQYIVLDQTNQTVTIKPYNECVHPQLSIGAIAKGYAIDQITPYLSEANTSFLLDLGRSSTAGTMLDDIKPYWVVSISYPFHFGQNLVLLKFDETYMMSTSGSENKYFIDEKTQQLHHHLINPHTGKSENYYQSVSIISDKNSTVLDALSTVLFSLPLEEAIDMIHTFEEAYDMEIEFLFVESQDDSLILHLSESLKDNIIETDLSINIKEFNYIGE